MSGTAGAGAIAGAGVRSLVAGTDFGDNLRAVLPDVIASTLAIEAPLQAWRLDDPGPLTTIPSFDITLYGVPSGGGYVDGSGILTTGARQRDVVKHTLVQVPTGIKLVH